MINVTSETGINLDELSDTIAVITGAGNNGIGWGLAVYAASELNMHVVIVDLHERLVTSAVAKLRELVPNVLVEGIACDVANPDEMTGLPQCVMKLMPQKRLGVVFANAGVMFANKILNSSFDEWKKTLDVNVLGVVNAVQAFVPELQKTAAPTVFCATASVGGLIRGDGGGASYQASKHAVVALMESLSFELVRDAPGVHLHVLCPCIVQSGLGETSAVNAAVVAGNVSDEDVIPFAAPDPGFAMEPIRHAAQVFHHIANGRFYVVTENVKPWVDHDEPFGATELIRERFDNIEQRTIDNRDAHERKPGMARSAILKGPMFQAMASAKRDMT